MDLFSTLASVAALGIWAWMFVTVVDKYLTGAKVMAEIRDNKSKDSTPTDQPRQTKWPRVKNKKAFQILTDYVFPMSNKGQRRNRYVRVNADELGWPTNDPSNYNRHLQDYFDIKRTLILTRDK